MKKLTVYAVLLLLSSSAFATIAQQRNAYNWSCSGTTNGSGVITCAASFTTTGATDLIAVWTTWQSAASLTATVADSYPPPSGPPDIYVSAVGPALQSASSTPTSAQIFYAKSIHGGADTVTVTLTGAPSQSVPSFGVVIVEYSGLDQKYPLDSVSDGYSYSAGFLLDSGTAAPGNANLLVFGAGTSDSGTAGVGSGFAVVQSSGGSITEQMIVSGNNTLQRATAGLTGVGSPGDWVMQMAVFRDASVPSGVSWVSPCSKEGALVEAGSSCYTTVAAALAAVPSGASTIRTPPGYAETFSTITIPSYVQLILGRGTTLTSNNNNSTNWAITMNTGGALICEGSGIGNSFSAAGCTVAGNGSFVGQGLLTNAPGGEYYTVQGISFRPSSLNTPNDVFQTATVWVNQMFVNSKLEDNNISAGCSAAGACIATGTGAVATASVSGGVVNPLVVMNSYGTGYTTAPLCLFTGGGGTGATCTANIGGGQITSVTVNSGGSGYTSAPNVCFGGNGCGGSVALQIDHSNAVLFENNNVGSQCLGTPVLIDGGNNQSVEFIGGAIQFPGFANFIEDINSNGVGNTHDINHLGVHYEQCNTAALGGHPQTQDAMRVRDADTVLFAGIQVSQSHGTAAFQLSESMPGNTNAIRVVGFTSQNVQLPDGVFLNNTIRPNDDTNFASAGQDVEDYTYINYGYAGYVTAAALGFDMGGHMLTNPHTTYFSGRLTSGMPSTATVSLVAPSAFTAVGTFACSISNQDSQTDTLRLVYTAPTTLTVTGPNYVMDHFSGTCTGN